MVIYTSEMNGVYTLDIQGRLTAAEAPQLQVELTKVMRNAKELVLDFAHLEYIASAGLRQLMIAQKYMENKGSGITVKNVGPEIMEILEDTGFDSVLKIEK